MKGIVLQVGDCLRQKKHSVVEDWGKLQLSLQSKEVAGQLRGCGPFQLLFCRSSKNLTDDYQRNSFCYLIKVYKAVMICNLHCLTTVALA